MTPPPPIPMKGFGLLRRPLHPARWGDLTRGTEVFVTFAVQAPQPAKVVEPPDRDGWCLVEFDEYGPPPVKQLAEMMVLR